MIGKMVAYLLSHRDAEAINRRRNDFAGYLRDGGTPTGHIGHFGNRAAAGQLMPAVIVASWHGDDTVNLQVFLDGNDTFWACSRTFGGAPGDWCWLPPAPLPAVEAPRQRLGTISVASG